MQVIKTTKIALLGGTGKAGKFVVDELLRQGIAFNMLVRDPGKVVHNSPLIEIVTGSARNFTTLQRLLSGCHAVISTLGPTKGDKTINSIAAGYLIKIMQKLKIKRYVEIAGLGIQTRQDKKGIRTRLISGVIRTLFPGRVKDRQEVYQMLSHTDLDWTIVRCPSIQLTEKKRNLIVSLEDSPGTKISAADLAGFLVHQIDDQQYIRKCPFVAS